MTTASAIHWYPGEIEVLSAKEHLSTADFAEKYRTVTIGAHRGSWDNRVTPYLSHVMDAADSPWVEELVICGPPQSGKTNACLNILLKHIYQFGGNGKFIMFPTELLAKLFYRVRLVPILQGCQPLSRRLSPDPRDTTSEKISLRDGTHLFPAWGSSAAKLSSFPADFVWADEIDKNAELTGDESDPLSLLEDRVRTARRRLILKCSSPTLENGHIWRALNKCLIVNEYHVRCPHCRESQRMDESRITWPGQAGLWDKGEISQPAAEPDILKSMKIARYVCAACGCLWDDQERNLAVRLGGWQPRTSQTIIRPRSIGYHIEGFICPDISLSDLAAEIIKARSGEPSDEKRRDNSFFGRPHVPQKAERSETIILQLRDDRPRGIVPRDIQALLMTVDTQQRGFWYEVRAVGWGQQLDTWQIREGYAESFADLLTISQADYHDPDGATWKIAAAIIDSGGGSGTVPQHSRTAEVYEFCRINRLFRPVKGRRGGDLWGVTRLDYYPSRDGKKIKIPGGLNLYTINVTYFKDQLSAKLGIHQHDPGAWRLHSDTADSYARQLCAEYRDDKGYWECLKGRDNHYWDCGVYFLALCEMLQIKLRKRPNQETGQASTPQPKRPSGGFVKRWR